MLRLHLQNTEGGAHQCTEYGTGPNKGRKLWTQIFENFATYSARQSRVTRTPIFFTYSGLPATFSSSA